MDSLDFRVYAPFTKISEETDGSLLVETVVNDETVDDQGEILDYEAVKRASADYMKWAAVREMHGDHAAGTMLSLTHDDEARATRGILKVVDPGAIRKVREGVYKGTSMGGRKLARVMQKIGASSVGRITDLVWVETSLVDRPSRPTAALTILKRSLTEEQMSKTADPEAAKPEEQVEEAPAKAEAPAEEKIEKAADPAPAEAPKPEEQAPAADPAPAPAEAKEGDPEDAKDEPAEDPVVAKVSAAIEAGFAKISAEIAKMTQPKAADPAPVAEEKIEKAATTDTTPPAPGVDPEAVGKYLVEHMAQSEAFAKAADVQAMRDDLAAAIKPLQEEIAKIAAQPATGGPLRYATDPRRPLEDAPEAQSAMSEALAKMAATAQDPAVREEIGRMAASEEMRALFR